MIKKRTHVFPVNKSVKRWCVTVESENNVVHGGLQLCRA